VQSSKLAMYYSPPEDAVENEDFVVHEELIRSEAVMTGFRGNMSYAAELGLDRGPTGW